MRGLMISVAVLVFAICVNIVNSVEDAHYQETNNTIYGWKTQPMDYSHVTDELEEDDMKASITPKEQPEGLIDQVWSASTYLVSGANFIFNVLRNSTYGFSDFIQHLNRPDFNFIPDYIANPLAIMINLNHMLLIIQFMTGRNLREGA